MGRDRNQALKKKEMARKTRESVSESQALFLIQIHNRCNQRSVEIAGGLRVKPSDSASVSVSKLVILRSLFRQFITYCPSQANSSLAPVKSNSLRAAPNSWNLCFNRLPTVHECPVATSLVPR